MNNKLKQDQRVFISHSSEDKEFVRSLSNDLDNLGITVWFDEWELSVGDSIIDKIFEGLGASDILIIVLSPSSVVSRWVKEELNVANMRRISDGDVRVLPVLYKDCEIPLALKHIKYADFRGNYGNALYTLMDSLIPGYLLQQSLNHYYNHFCLLCDKYLAATDPADGADSIIQMYALLESGLNLRTEIELRKRKQNIRDLNFFEKIVELSNQGLNIRSQTWNILVTVRSQMMHSMRNNLDSLQTFTKMLGVRYHNLSEKEAIKAGLDRLKEIMKIICYGKK